MGLLMGYVIGGCVVSMVLLIIIVAIFLEISLRSFELLGSDWRAGVSAAFLFENVAVCLDIVGVF